MIGKLKVSLVLLPIVNYILSCEALSVRGQQLQYNITSELKIFTENFDEAFPPIKEFHDEMKAVVGKSLANENVEIKNYMDSNQYKYYGLVYRFEKSAEDNKAKVIGAYAALRETCEKLTVSIDTELVRMEDVLKRRGCSQGKIENYMDGYFDQVQIGMHFELIHLERMKDIGSGVGNQVHFVQRNVISNLYECNDNHDFACYLNNQGLFDIHADFIETTYNGFAQYQIESVDEVDSFLNARVAEDMSGASNAAWTMSCEDPTTIISTEPSKSTGTTSTTEAPTEPSRTK